MNLLGHSLPPKITVDRQDTVQQYTRERLRQHTLDTYAGVPISKFPEDLRVYEHLLWLSMADVVIELGVQYGGSTLWFRDRLASLRRYRTGGPPMVIGVDVDVDRARTQLQSADPEYATDITLIEADVTDPELPARVRANVRPQARCFVVEDSAHTFPTTIAALRGFAEFVPVGGFFVVEDGCVDVEELRISSDWPRGVLPALREWLSGQEGRFVERADLELYGVTCHPHGFLQRVS